MLGNGRSKDVRQLLLASSFSYPACKYIDDTADDGEQDPMELCDDASRLMNEVV
jgi:hypothetical protein